MDYRHGELPKTDDYSFYLSYHAMLSIAPKLAEKMQVIEYEDYPSDEWGEWLNRHIVINPDGSWRSDRRDPVPHTSEEWDQDKKNEDWRWRILPENFLNCLLSSEDEEPWIYIDGSWNQTDGQYEESYWTESMLVSTETAESLLYTLNYCRDIHNQYFPREDESHGEEENPNFVLTEWVKSRNDSDYLDDHDPHSGGITSSPRVVRKMIVERMKLRETPDQREWYFLGEDDPSIVSELWSEGIGHDKEAPHMHGCRLKASLKFLKKLCEEFQKHLIISVKIHRSIPKYHRKKDEEINHYQWPYLNFYILSPDGTVRDARKYITIG